MIYSISQSYADDPDSNSHNVVDTGKGMDFISAANKISEEGFITREIALILSDLADGSELRLLDTRGLYALEVKVYQS